MQTTISIDLKENMTKIKYQAEVQRESHIVWEIKIR